MPIQMDEEEYRARQEALEEDLERDIPASPIKPLGERQMEKLIDPDVPTDTDSKELNKLWIFSSKATRHIELTNIPTPEAHKIIRRKMTDLTRIAHWDADEYLQVRMAKFFVTDILGGKSIGYTRHSRERDALNENRITQTIRDDRPLPPRESGGFLNFVRGRR